MVELRSLALENVEILLTNCLQNDEVTRLASHFQNHRLLPAGFTKDGRPEIGKLFHHIRDSAYGITEEYFKKVCQEADFPGGSNVSKLVWSLSSIDDGIGLLTQKLLLSWKDLLGRKNETLQFIKEKMPSLWDNLLDLENDCNHDWLILLLVELTNSKTESLFKELEDILAKEPSQSNPNPLEAARKLRDDSDPMTWLNLSINHLAKSRSILKHDVQSIWPGEPELLDENLWPSSLYTKALNDADGMTKFIEIVKTKLPKEDAMPGRKKRLLNAREWLNKNVLRVITEKHALLNLVKEYFPTEPELLQKWPGKIIEKCTQSEGEDVIEFLESLQLHCDPNQSSKISVTAASDNGGHVNVGNDTTGQWLEPVTEPVVSTQPKSEPERLKMWLIRSHSTIKKIQDDRLTAFISQVFQEKQKEILFDPNWPFLLIQEILAIKDKTEFMAKALQVENIVNEISQDQHIQRNKLPNSSIGMNRENLEWFKNNQKMLQRYSHRTMMFITQKFTKEEWYKEGQEFTSLMDELIKHCENFPESDEVNQLIQLLRDKTNQSQSGSITELETEIVVKFQVLPLKKKRLLKQQFCHDKKVESLKLWTSCLGEEMEMNLRRNDRWRHFQTELRFPCGVRIFYRYYTDSGPEILNQSRTTTLNRVLELPKDKKELVLLDYTSAEEYTLPNVMHKHLPKTKLLDHPGKEVATKIMQWVNAVESRRFVEVEDSAGGCKYTITIGDSKAALSKWLSKVMNHTSSSFERHRNAFIGCAVATALSNAGVQIISEDVRSKLFSLMDIGKLSKDDQIDLKTKLASYVFPTRQAKQMCGLNEAFFLLFFNEIFNPKLVLALPLYWLFGKTTFTKSTLERECWLPSAVKKDYWERKRVTARTNEQQKELMNMMSSVMDLSKQHPWILKSYIYFMVPRSLNTFLKKQRYTIALDYDFLFENLDLHSIDDIDDMRKTLGMLTDKVDDGQKALGCRRIEGLNGTLDKLLEKQYVAEIFRNEILMFCVKVATLSSGPELDCDLKPYFMQTVDRVCTNLERSGIDKDQMIVWDRISKMNWPGKTNLSIMEVMKRVVKDEWIGKEMQCIEFYVTNVMEKIKSGPLVDLFDETAEGQFEKYMEKIQNNMEMGKKRRTLEKLSEKFPSKTKNLKAFFNSYLRRKLQKYETEHFLLLWKFSVEFVTAFDGAKYEEFDPETRKIMYEKIDTFHSVIKSLLGDYISYNQFDEIRGYEKKCLELTGILFEEQKSGVEGKFHKWSEVLADCENFKKGIENFVAKCSQQDVNTEELRSILSVDLKSRKLCDIATSSPDGQITYPVLKPLRANELTALHRDIGIQENTYYKMLWKKKSTLARKDNPVNFTWKDVLSRILIPTQDEVKCTATAINAGTLKLREIPNIFYGYSTLESTSKQLEEFFRLSDIKVDDGINLKTRAEEVTTCLQHHKLLGISKMMKEAAEWLKLDPNFFSSSEITLFGGVISNLESTVLNDMQAHPPIGMPPKRL